MSDAISLFRERVSYSKEGLENRNKTVNNGPLCMMGLKTG